MHFNLVFHKIRIIRYVVVSVICIFSLQILKADMLYHTNDCNPTFDPKTNITWYGDSWGDFVDMPLYGWADWETYFSFHQPNVDWRIQNLAVGGATTHGPYNLIKDCAKDVDGVNYRNNYKTAANVVLEIGGNDFMHHIPFMVYAPWMYPRIQQRVLQNTEAIIVSLKHPRRHKNVLVVGHIPQVTTSPSLGKQGDYFRPMAIQPGYENLKTMTEIREKKQGPYEDQFLDGALHGDIRKLATVFSGDVSTIIATHAAFESVNYMIDNMFSGAQCSYMAWYCAWIDLNASDFGWTSLSLAMLLHQGSLEAMAYRNGAEFLPMYPWFVREKDCLLGACWVAKHILYSEPIHKNYLGYFLYSYHVSNKIVQLGWQNNMPTNGGLIDAPATAIPDSEEGNIQPEIVQPEPIDLWLLCFFTGLCW
jgi:hypothetical protein